ncbi:MAG TPA: response regulator transcription factor [Chitinophaga sp.]|uniref:response regulator transcription factor n=1 Tax=Chitinophaga sp. TaxID=1869181 RepID=UPI002CFE8ECD|nr:response regulator transcription factor [Chitinophaga sp.]HVI46056.1 response regulator transcription factor [Chitinophaga sp.]
MISVITVDDHPIVLEGLRNLLSASTDMKLEKQLRSANEAMQALITSRPDIVLLDIGLPDMNGITLCAEIKKQYSHISVIIFSNSCERSTILSAISNGASGYILKNALQEDILAAIKRVYDGGIYFCYGSQQALNSKKPELDLQLPHLTRREKEILSLIGNGNTSQEIASRLFISTYTVDGHRKKMMEKFKVNNMAAVVKIATENNLM